MVDWEGLTEERFKKLNLSESVSRIYEKCGFTATVGLIQLARERGKPRNQIYIPMNPTADHPIASYCGYEGMIRLCKAFRGGAIDVFYKKIEKQLK